MGETPNQRVMRDAGSRLGRSARPNLSALNMVVAGTILLVSYSADSHACTHARTLSGISRTFYYEVADTCVLYLVVCISFQKVLVGVVAIVLPPS